MAEALTANRAVGIATKGCLGGYPVDIPASMRSLEPEDSYTVMDGDPKRAHSERSASGL
jgi:hypothetical protein